MRAAARPVAVAALTVLAVTGPAASAHAENPPGWPDKPSLSITPDPAVPGSTVIVSVSGGCTATSATATSTAFSEAVQLSTGSAGAYTGTATISESATGTHTVNVSCASGGTSTHSISVGRGGSGHTGWPATTIDKGVKAGVGSDDGLSATDITQLVLGGLLMAGAIGGGVYVVRRRSTD
ncbi:hypothetical protein AB0J38_44725 [Streptomyces sp. NPDC050095]|uniref:hypothetical protein n=1 Tax=unclassified Streptomyces TaxID=2593676 RepID=UPI0034370BF0